MRDIEPRLVDSTAWPRQARAPGDQPGQQDGHKQHEAGDERLAIVRREHPFTIPTMVTDKMFMFAYGPITNGTVYMAKAGSRQSRKADRNDPLIEGMRICRKIFSGHAPASRAASRMFVSTLRIAEDMIR